MAVGIIDSNWNDNIFINLIHLLRPIGPIIPPLLINTPLFQSSPPLLINTSSFNQQQKRLSLLPTVQYKTITLLFIPHLIHPTSIYQLPKLEQSDKYTQLHIILRHQQYKNMTQSTLPKLPQDQYISISNQGLQYIYQHHDPNNPNKNFLWTDDYKVELPVRVKKAGPGSALPYTLIQLWQDCLEKYSNNTALTWQDKPGHWASLTYKQYHNEALRFAKALITLGISEYTAVNIIGFNSVEWAIAFHGSILGHYLPIGQYTTNGPEACAYIANHSQAEIVIMQDASQMSKYLTILPEVKRIKYYVIWKGDLPKNLPAELKDRVLLWKDFMAISDQYKPQRPQDTLEERANIQKPGNCATFIYTSGTTGPPKAVMISHDNYTFVTDAVIEPLGLEEDYGNTRLLSLLPLSHVAAQLVDLIIAIKAGANVFFTDPSALQGNLVKFLHACRPTFFVTVPRVWQKIEEKLTAVGLETTGLKRKIADWAKSMGAEGTYAEINGGSLPSFWGLAKKLVFNKVKQGLGLDQCKKFIFSAAPLKESTRKFFLNLNIYLQNIYGMSELAGPETVTDPKALKSFTTIQSLKEAGVALPGLQLSINNPDAEGNGEICLRGRNVFMGYFKNEKETKETIDQKGFVHSGDIGYLNQNKVLSITGRIKELIITAGGENVAPVLIQNEINTALPLFSQVVVIGDKRKYLTCLLVLKTKSPGLLADELINYIKTRGSNATTVQQAISCKNLYKIIEQGISIANKKAMSNAQKVQKFLILKNDFGVDTGELTPTLKIKRKIVNQKYEAEIYSMYPPEPKL